VKKIPNSILMAFVLVSLLSGVSIYVYSDRINKTNAINIEATIVNTGRKLYVSPFGNDTNDGSFNNPWRTIAYATCGGTYLCPCSVSNPNPVTAGDTLFLRGGIYDVSDSIKGAITFSNSGTLLEPIVIKNYPGENPIINGNYKNIIFWVGKYANNDNIIFDGLTITKGQVAGIFIGQRDTCSNITIKNCIITDILRNDNTACIYLSNTWSNVVIYKCNLACGINNGEGIIIFKGGNNVQILNNEIDSSMHGIYFKHASSDNRPFTLNHNLVKNNFIHNTLSSGIHVVADRVDIRNNLLVHTLGINIFPGIGATCEYSHADSCSIVNNTIADHGINLGDPLECILKGAHYTNVKKNVITGGNVADLFIWPYTDAGTRTHGTAADSNLYYSTASKPFAQYHLYYNFANFKIASGLDLHSIFSQPIFVNVSINNYRLTSSSPAYGYGWGANIDSIQTLSNIN
jgi:hypothetical protein